ncbi:hypothetical protein KIW84_066403 [Lathyrus oleraceus]|uniref:Uncharacterized protein n=1 Tax=Pisum sativum TaxID=3888 RepID=A0A9D4WFP5_PEA|nr:hypothetical protein KIW84_066403 [Pisum sativum]
MAEDEIMISRSTTEKRALRRHDLMLDRLSELEKEKLIANLVKIQKDGTVIYQYETVEVDLERSASVASELLEFQSYEESTMSGSFIISDSKKSVPRLQILILVVGTRGDVQPFVAIAKRLQACLCISFQFILIRMRKEYGHRVRIAIHANFKTFVRSAGVNFHPLGGDPRLRSVVRRNLRLRMLRSVEKKSQDLVCFCPITVSVSPASNCWIRCFSVARFAVFVSLADLFSRIMAAINAVEPYRILGATDGHTDSVLGLAWNKEDRKLFASASADKQIKIWDLVHVVAWSEFLPYLLLSGSSDRTVVVVIIEYPLVATLKCLLFQIVTPYISGRYAFSWGDGGWSGNTNDKYLCFSVMDSSLVLVHAAVERSELGQRLNAHVMLTIAFAERSELGQRLNAHVMLTIAFAERSELGQRLNAHGKFYAPRECFV